MSSVLPLPGTSHRVEDELLQIYARQGLTVPVPVLFSAILIATLSAARAPLWMTLGWVAAVAAVLALRWWVIRQLARMTEPSVSVRMNIIASISFIGGTVHALSTAFWPYMSVLDRAVQSMFMLALCAGAVVSTSGYLRIFVAYLVPTMTALAVAWGLALGGINHPWQGTAARVLLLLFAVYVAFLLVLARHTMRLFRESFETRQRLSAALEQAEAANRAKTRFLASASHDLRQPMHTLSLFGAALTMRPLDERSRDIAAQMNLALQALSSQLDAGVVSVKESHFSISDFLRRLHEEFLPIARAKGLRMVLECPPEAMGRTDPMLLERVVRNLIDNAIKYTSRGMVTLSLQNAGARFELLIQDTGPGIAPAEQERVFEEFYQIGNPERDRTQGLGLGLSIVRRLADLLGLDLSMASARGAGTTFTLYVPRVGTPARQTVAAQEPLPSIDGVRVLVVDDEEGVRRGMQTLLESLGCHVSLATGTEGAGAAARARAPDIVLADLRLRGQDDGIAAVHALRQAYPGLPALLVSGDTAPARLRDAHAAALRLLHKPVAVDVLARAIREEVDRSGRPHGRQE